jgi:hypothetical protein
VSLSEDGKTVRIESLGLKPSWGMEIQYTFRSADGQLVQGTIHNTIHQLGVQAAVQE